MIICGVDLSASNANLVILDCSENSYQLVDAKPEKISLNDDESADEIKSFLNKFHQHMSSFNCELVLIRKRKKTGKFSGGAVSFKMEALIQALDLDIRLVDAPKVNAIARKHKNDFPEKLKKYQENAFYTALYGFQEISG